MMADQGNSALEVLQLKSEIEYLSKLIRKHQSVGVKHTKQYHGSQSWRHGNYQTHNHISLNKKWVSTSNNNKVIEQKQQQVVQRSSTATSTSVSSHKQLSSLSNCNSPNGKTNTTLKETQLHSVSSHTTKSGRTTHGRMVLKPAASRCSTRVVLKPAGCVKAESPQRPSPAVQYSSSDVHCSKSHKVALSSGLGGIPAGQQCKYSDIRSKVGQGVKGQIASNAATHTTSKKDKNGEWKRGNVSISNSLLKRSVLQPTDNSLGGNASSGPYRVVRYSENSSGMQHKINNVSDGILSSASHSKAEISQRSVISPALESSLSSSQSLPEKCTSSKYSAVDLGTAKQNPLLVHSPQTIPTQTVCITKSRYKLTRKSSREKTDSHAELKTFVTPERKYRLSKTNVATTNMLHYPVTSTPGLSVKKGRYKPKTAFHWEQTSRVAKVNPSKYHWGRKLSNSQLMRSAASLSTSSRSTTIKLSSRYKLIRKAIKISHRKNTKLNLSLNNKYTFTANRTPKKTAGSCRKNKVWNKKYSLNRNLTGYHQSGLRPVHNLSHSQFKFINLSFRGKLQGSKRKYAYHGLTKIDRRRSSERRSITQYLPMRSRFVLNNKTSLSPETAKRIINKSLRTERIKDVASRMLQRSIYTAHLAKFKKNGKDNKKTYCLYYNRFGKCHRGNQCHYIHDPARIAICTRFLRGRCEVDNCPFSHNVSKEKMPVCQYFIKGVCSRDNCPYLHSNVAKDAEVCDDFIQGFCVLGDQCKKKHILVCPDYKKHGSCSQGNKCKLRHVKHVAKKRKYKEPTTCVASKVAKKDVDPDEDFDDIELPLGERKLPSYIPLDLTLDSVNTSQLSDGESLLIHPRLSLGAESDEVADNN